MKKYNEKKSIKTCSEILVFRYALERISSERERGRPKERANEKRLVIFWPPLFRALVQAHQYTGTRNRYECVDENASHWNLCIEFNVKHRKKYQSLRWNSFFSISIKSMQNGLIMVLALDLIMENGWPKENSNVPFANNAIQRLKWASGREICFSCLFTLYVQQKLYQQ